MKEGFMIRKLFVLAGALALPAIVAAQTPQIPNEHASDTAQVKVARHRQNPQVPAVESSDIAKQKVAEHRATRRRGEVVRSAAQPPTWILPNGPAKPAVTQPGVGVVTPAAPAMPVTPASPPGKPSSPGQSGSHRP